VIGARSTIPLQEGVGEEIAEWYDWFDFEGEGQGLGPVWRNGAASGL
jgi:hypothetical protein